ncbi:acyl-[acyl-carrier-protein] thioesterase [Breznakiella homolactica]|uniref:Acyl-ACP thioesterase n=1 Tax=Breznakiella homolactica TaxID=2798577 RepID=A0A7T7XPD8_9SPIR|nr:acyl-ACP thioesterase domain-containing protein [Breznakiella homolactica]QQO10050.1 hypothetical protein JFL75_03800 [Breznakiella homolactica]
MYEYSIKIGMGHIGKDGLLKLGSAVDLLQNASWFQMDDDPELTGYFSSRGTGMYLTYRQMNILRLPAYGEEVTVKSWVCGCDSLFGYRSSAVYTDSGSLCIGSAAIGPFIDLQKRTPTRLPKEILHSVVIHEPLDMEVLSRRVRLPDTMESTEENIVVHKQHLDKYGHMNNARYVDIASNYVPDDFTPGMMRAEYKTAAVEGDILVPHTHRNDGGTFSVILANTSGAPYAVMEFRERLPEGQAY